MSISRITQPAFLQLPIELHTRLPCTWGELDGEKRLFLIDTGAQEMLLNSRHLAPGNGEVAGMSIGVTGKVSMRMAHIRSLSFGGLRFEDTDVLAVDMGHLEDDYGVAIHGLIGFRTLVDYDWMVDYAAEQITLWNRFPKADFKLRAKIPAEYRHHLPTIEVKIAGRPFIFLVDTGASMVLLDQRWREFVLPVVDALTEEKMASASAVEARFETGTLAGFEAGGLAFGPCEFKLGDLTQLQSQGPHFDGILGYPLLSQYRIVVSWSNHSLYILED